MLEVAQAGQAGKSSLLFDMHRFRKRVFHDKMRWNVPVTPDGLEVDNYDLPNTIYLLSLNSAGRVVGNWRLLPTDGPTMIRDIWPQFLESIDMPSNPKVWEASRFGVESFEPDTPEGLAQVARTTQELFCGLTELCILCGIEKVFTMYDMRIARLLRRLDCEPEKVSQRISIEGNTSQVGCFITNKGMLHRLQEATGITHSLITPEMIPPFLNGQKENPFFASAPRPLSFVE